MVILCFHLLKYLNCYSSPLIHSPLHRSPLLLSSSTPLHSSSLTFYSVLYRILTAYLAVWYLGNIYYNIFNKKACIALGKNAAGASNAHWALSAVQVGYCVCLLWCLHLYSYFYFYFCLSVCLLLVCLSASQIGRAHV